MTATLTGPKVRSARLTGPAGKATLTGPARVKATLTGPKVAKATLTGPAGAVTLEANPPVSIASLLTVNTAPSITAPVDGQMISEVVDLGAFTPAPSALNVTYLVDGSPQLDIYVLSEGEVLTVQIDAVDANGTSLPFNLGPQATAAPPTVAFTGTPALAAIAVNAGGTTDDAPWPTWLDGTNFSPAATVGLFVDNVEITAFPYTFIAGTAVEVRATAPGSSDLIVAVDDNVSVAVPAQPSAPTFASPTNDDTPALVVGTGITDTVALYVDGVAVAATYDPVAGTLTPDVALVDGTYALTVTHTNAGGESPESASLMITIDTVAPVLGSLTVGAPTGTNYPATIALTEANSLPVTIYFGAYLTSGTALTDQQVIDGTGNGFQQVTTSTSLTNQNVDLGALAAGDYTLKAVVIDGAGGQGASQTTTFTVSGESSIDFSSLANGDDLLLHPNVVVDFNNLGPTELIVDTVSVPPLLTPTTPEQINYRASLLPELGENQFIQFVINTWSPDLEGLTLLLCSDLTFDNYYRIILTPNYFNMDKKIAGVTTQFQNFLGHSIGDGDTVRFEYVPDGNGGSQIQLVVNGDVDPTTVAPADPALTSGHVAFRQRHNQTEQFSTFRDTITYGVI